jgi:Uma2 family endonuclease
MDDAHELIEAPLSAEELAVRYRALCDDPCYASVPGKIELDLWGRMLMSPPSVYHGVVQARLVHTLKAALGGETMVETPIVTPFGLFVADVAWASAGFMGAHGAETPLTCAPEICGEVVSPSNSAKELREKIDGYLAAGAEEVWVVYPQSKRCEFYGKQGKMPRSAYNVELGDLFA